jgi:hypothetical protein
VIHSKPWNGGLRITHRRSSGSIGVRVTRSLLERFRV